MNKISCILLVISLIFSSCGSTKRKHSISNQNKKKESGITSKKLPKNRKIRSIINFAKTFEGTRYKYGGTTKKGMDCSGLVYTSFKKEKVILPRTSRAMATQGSKISLKKVIIGDLLFFKTNKKKKNSISHVGLVVKIGKRIEFIHASTSKGVTISSLDEKYWNTSFTEARRIL